jgi:hypothetical protein
VTRLDTCLAVAVIKKSVLCIHIYFLAKELPLEKLRETDFTSGR